MGTRGQRGVVAGPHPAALPAWPSRGIWRNHPAQQLAAWRALQPLCIKELWSSTCTKGVYFCLPGLLPFPTLLLSLSAARRWQEVTLQIHPQPGAGGAVSRSISLNEPWGRERHEMLHGAVRSSPCSVSLGSSGGRMQPAEERGNKVVSSFKYTGSCPSSGQLDSGVVLGCILLALPWVQWGWRHRRCSHSLWVRLASSQRAQYSLEMVLLPAAIWAFQPEFGVCSTTHHLTQLQQCGVGRTGAQHVWKPRLCSPQHLSSSTHLLHEREDPSPGAVMGIMQPNRRDLSMHPQHPRSISAHYLPVCWTERCFKPAQKRPQHRRWLRSALAIRWALLCSR